MTVNVDPTETQFSETFRKYVELHGWLAYHTWNSKHSTPGFPDWVLIKNNRLVVAELKKNSKLRPTLAQQQWLDAFAMIDGCETYLWTPDDWDEIERVLS